MSAAAVRIPPARCKEAAGLGCMIGRTKQPFGAFEHLAKTTLRIRWLDSQNVLRGSPPRVVFAKVPRFEGGLRQGSRCRSSANVGSTRRHSCCSGVAAMQGAAATATTTQHRCFGTAAAAHTQRYWRLAWPPAPRRRHLMKGLRVCLTPHPLLLQLVQTEATCPQEREMRRHGSERLAVRPARWSKRDALRRDAMRPRRALRSALEGAHRRTMPCTVLGLRRSPTALPGPGPGPSPGPGPGPSPGPIPSPSSNHVRPAVED